MTWQARGLLMDPGGRAEGFRFFIRDRDAMFTGASGAVLTAAGTGIIGTPARALRVNVIAERWIAGARRECPGRMLITSGRHLRPVLDEYADHCNARGLVRPGKSGGRYVCELLVSLPDSSAA